MQLLRDINCWGAFKGGRDQKKRGYVTTEQRAGRVGTSHFWKAHFSE